MRALRITIVALLVWCAFAVIARAEIAVPMLTGRVIDQTSTLSGDEISKLSAKLKDLQARKGSQIAVLIVPTTDGEAIEQFGIRVAEAWKIGRKNVDDGAILLVAKSDRKLRIEVGYGLEGALNDITAKRIIDEIITPKFKQGDFDGGVEAGVEKMIGVIDGEPLPVPKPQHDWSGGEENWTGLFYVVVFGTLIANAFLRRFLGRLPAAAISGVATVVIALVCDLIWYLAVAAGTGVFALGLMFDFADRRNASRRGSGGGWIAGGSSDSGSSWSSGSSSSSDSGFSGGGGSFGGGGASGSW